MTDSLQNTLILASIILPLFGIICSLFVSMRRILEALGVACGATGFACGTSLLVAPSAANEWLVADRISGVYICVVAAVCTMSCLVASSYLSRSSGAFFSKRYSPRAFWVAMFAFWAALALLPLIANLAVAWLVIEASTAASAVLVAHSGRDRALEAGWKYLILTTLGLAVAFLAIVIMRVSSNATGDSSGLSWTMLASTFAAMPYGSAVTAYALIMLGLAAKIGWAPLHSWLPDAHSEAPAPISAMLSAALLPAVMLVGWRVHDAARTTLGDSVADAPLLAFGIFSMAVAIPFLWQPLAWKRLLAYSSLEHMGIIALGIAFGGHLAITGVIIHIAGHALAKSLGFYASIPLLDAQPEAARRRARHLTGSAPATSGAMIISSITLAGLPPGPLFVSEFLIIIGGFQTGHTYATSALALLLALAFLGMLIPALALFVTPPTTSSTRAKMSTMRPEKTRAITFATTVVGAALLAISIGGWTLANSSILIVGARGVS